MPMFARPIVHKPPARTWRLIAVLADGRGIGDCGHRHADDLEAVRCRWTPEPWPEVCDLLVRQVRDDKEQRRMPW